MIKRKREGEKCWQKKKKNTPMKFLDIGLKIRGSKNAFESSHE